MYCNLCGDSGYTVEWRKLMTSLRPAVIPCPKCEAKCGNLTAGSCAECGEAFANPPTCACWARGEVD